MKEEMCWVKGGGSLPFIKNAKVQMKVQILTHIKGDIKGFRGSKFTEFTSKTWNCRDFLEKKENPWTLTLHLMM